MLQAKTHLSRLVADLENSVEDEIIIARHGRPVATLRSYRSAAAGKPANRIGAAQGVFEVPSDIDSPYGDLSHLFGGGQ
ncbi:MAG: prevent-host-death protein [Spirochaetaceae bacterium]|nr:MAG: prevent-host-death protein [Spirochaetaceae bacterium]